MSSLGRGFSALRHPNYRLFWFGQLVSLIGTWMQTVAQSWLVLQLTGSAVDLGIVNALQLFPVLVIGMFGGVFADRLPKRRLLIMTQTFQMLLALILGILVSTRLVEIWHVFLLATLLGVANAFDMPTRQSFVVEMVGRDDLMNAVALNSMQFNAARIVGPALAGISIAAIGVAGSFYANAASFVFVIVGLAMMRTDRFFAVDPAPRTSVFGSMAEGCRYVLKTPTILMITALVGVLGIFAFNTNVLVPLFARDVLHSGASGYGLLMAAMGAGSLLAALTAAFLQRTRWDLLLGGATVFCVFELFFAFSQIYWLSLLLLGIAGYGLITFFMSTNTGVQQKVPDQLRGRVMGVYMTVNVGATPFGNLASGAMASSFGAPVAMAVGAAAGLVTVLFASGWIFLHRGNPELALAPTMETALPVRHDHTSVGPVANSRATAERHSEAAAGRRAI